MNIIHEVREARRRPGRIRAITLLLAGVTLATVFTRTGTTVITTGPRPATTCGAFSCSGVGHTGGHGGGGTHGAGGGTVRIGP